jgi:hypothetical protein
MTSKTKVILLGSTLAVIITTIILFVFNYKSNPTLTQDTFPASTEQKFIYENSSDGPIVEVSNDSSYFELRTRFGDVQLTDIGTQKEIDSLRPVRAKDVVQVYNKYQKFLNK